MSPQVALAVFLGLIAWLFIRDVRRRASVSTASWLVVMWAVIFASRPVSMWFETGGAPRTVEGYLEGSPTDRAAFLVLIVLASVVLLRRQIPFHSVIRQNGWLFAFYAYCLVSVLWADYPFVSFKRWFKDFGCVIMVLVLLTERNPAETIKAVFVRCAYLLVPLSVLWIKYYPALGRAYNGYHRDNLMYVGVANHKNLLGQMLLVCSLVIVWDLVSRRRAAIESGGKFEWMDGGLVLGLSFWLLAIADSATSLVCTTLGVGIFLATGTKMVRRQVRFAEIYTAVAVGVWFALDYAFNIAELIITGVLGRNMTLTSRTPMWELVLSQQDVSPLFGTGFLSFWTGDRMARLWVDLPGIVQAHSGYVETYLNLGLVGLLLLAAVVLSSVRRIKAHLQAGDDFSRLRITFVAISLFYNYSEASFNSLSLLWLVMLLVLAEAPKPLAAVSPAPAVDRTRKFVAGGVPAYSRRIAAGMDRHHELPRK